MVSSEYKMHISRRTVDKLGVKLYDKVSAVIAELISNSYDADATEVLIRAPMGKYLANKNGEKVTTKSDKSDFEISVKDDGHGMTPEEMQDFYLVVGAERRQDRKRGKHGSISRKYGRRVMGRKGVGKLAPFGICRVIEIISSGGDEVEERGEKGFRTSHVILNYDDITDEAEDMTSPYKPKTGPKDNSLSPAPGTCVKLSNFNYRKVPDKEALPRQIAQRFGITSSNWTVKLSDNSPDGNDGQFYEVSKFDVQYMPGTNIEFKDNETIGPDGKELADVKAGFSCNNEFHSIKGWMAYSKIPYRDDLMAGVRIYCRGKIAAQTAVFNQTAGFTGEHKIRSYLVGELHADWLDEKEDLIQTDRRDILWSDEVGQEFERWGQSIVKRIGAMARKPMQEATLEIFLRTSRIEGRAKEAYPVEEAIRDRAIALASLFGKTISREEAGDEEAVKDLADLSLDLAPHVTLSDEMKKAAGESETSLQVLSSILRTAKLAELASFGRIAKDRIRVMENLRSLKADSAQKENSLQKLIEDAPWLINPEWAPVTTNQPLSSLRNEFQAHLKNIDQDVNLTDFDNPNRRPDFVLMTQEGVVQIVEIKRPGHKLTNEEMDRINDYLDQMKEFLNKSGNEQMAKLFQSVHATVICDGLKLTGVQKNLFEKLKKDKELTHLNWGSLLDKSQKANQDFLDEIDRQKKRG